MAAEEIIEWAREALEHPVTVRSDADVRDVVDRCETARRMLLAVQLQALAEAEHRGLPADDGAPSTKAWLQQRLRIAGADAAGRVRVARGVEQRRAMTGLPLPPEMPATAEALREGEIGLDHAKAVVDGVRKLSGVWDAQRCERAEAFLAGQSRILGPKDLTTVAAHLTYMADQDGVLRDEERQYEDRELHVSAGQNGLTLLKGRLDRETGAKLRAALEPLAAPRPEKGGTKDPRTAGQRNADALSDLLDIVLSTDDLPRSGGQRPHITVTIPLENLKKELSLAERGATGVLDNTGEPLTAANVRRIACDSAVLPVVLGGDSQPLDVGRAQRTAPPHLRAALLARDTKCAFPGCDHPFGTSEAHHAIHWLDGGETALNNLAMLCAAHHRVVHAQEWDIDLSTGHPVFIPPTTIDTRRKPRPGNRPLHQLDFDMPTPNHATDQPTMAHSAGGPTEDSTGEHGKPP